MRTIKKEMFETNVKINDFGFNTIFDIERYLQEKNNKEEVKWEN